LNYQKSNGTNVTP